MLRGMGLLRLLLLLGGCLLRSLGRGLAVPVTEAHSEVYNVVVKSAVSLKDHIESAKMAFPAVTIEKIYWNLAKYNYQGYTVHIPTADIGSYQTSFQSEIKIIEAVGQVHAAGVGVEKLPYNPPFSRLEETMNLVNSGFCMITYETYHRFLDKNTDSVHPNPENEVTVYVLDSGIQTNHPAFSGRITTAPPFLSPPLPLKKKDDSSPVPGQDTPLSITHSSDSEPTSCSSYSHGTQVASLIGGRGVGVNTRVRMVDVRVLDQAGKGRTDDVLAALDYVAGQSVVSEDIVTRRAKSIINMSFSGASSKALKHALYTISKIMLVVAALGDDDSYACQVSPAESPHIVTVGAITPAGLPRKDSNYGDCIDMLAPGEDIRVLTTAPDSINKEGGVLTETETGLGAEVGKLLSGSSASAAIVTGFASLLFSALLEDPSARRLLTDTLNDDDISPFLRTAVMYNERAMVPAAHSHSWLPECSIGTKDSLLEIMFYSLKKLKDSLTIDDPKRPKAFNNLKRNFASFIKKKNRGKYED